ncbi:MAG: DUF3108 domain-containing protein [Opitutaceae bacterium]|nr:DUF3108 domain-containing protein [Opitutaceae bacterium]
MKTGLFPLLLGVMALSLPAAPFTTFQDGETFTYRVGWGIFWRAGKITIAAREKTVNGAREMHVTTEIRSRGIIRAFYEYENRGEVVFDQDSGRLLVTREKGSDGRHDTDTETTFDYSSHVARHVDRVHADRSTTVSIPEGCPLDLISALVQTRDWNLKPGEKRDVLVNFGEEFFALALYAVDFEEVRTPLGTYRTLMLAPRMEKDPKGVFKRGGRIRVWISQGETKLPVKMQLQLNFGSATMLLADYRLDPRAPQNLSPIR